MVDLVNLYNKVVSVWDWTSESEDPMFSLTLNDEYGLQVCFLSPHV
jgi:hypothetical protein